MSAKDFTGWHARKLAINQLESQRYFYEREIWWVAVGHNVGSEEDGKGASYARPVIVYRKFNQSLFYGLPLSTTPKTGKYYYAINTLGVTDKVLLSHMREFDAKRLISKIAVVSSADYSGIRRQLLSLLS